LRVGLIQLILGVLCRQKRFRKWQDTAAVLAQLICQTTSKLLAIIANTRGAEMASSMQFNI
jgi:hydroxymethylglutaryl-CoA lyase